jgi:hypothetical protein
MTDLAVKTCAVPGCPNPREDDRSFCGGHGPDHGKRKECGHRGCHWPRLPGSRVCTEHHTPVQIEVERRLAANKANNPAPWSHAGRQDLKFGKVNTKLHCPHCNTTGQVRSRETMEKRGATSTSTVVLFGPLGLGQRKRIKVTHFHCENCGTDWEA